MPPSYARPRAPASGRPPRLGIATTHLGPAATRASSDRPAASAPSSTRARPCSPSLPRATDGCIARLTAFRDTAAVLALQCNNLWTRQVVRGVSEWSYLVSNCAFSTGREATLASLNRVVGDEDQPPDRQARRAGPRRIGGHARAS